MADTVKFNNIAIGDSSWGRIVSEGDDGVIVFEVSGWVAKSTRTALRTYQQTFKSLFGLSDVGVSVQKHLRAGGAKLYPSDRLKTLKLATGEVYTNVGMQSVEWESDHTNSSAFTVTFIKSA